MRLPLGCKRYQKTMKNTEIDYNQVRKMFGKVVSDGTHTYNVSDYSMGCDAYKLWCNDRQQLFYTSYKGVHQLMEIVGDAYPEED